MSQQATGRAGRSEEAQCYNCGNMGHWAIACPEPTRQTPAGLTAWRNSSNSTQPSTKGNNSNANKRSKGPIITKYAAPAPPAYGHGLSSLPPIPPAPGQHHHSASSYPGSAHSYPSYAPPPPPPPPSSASYAPGYAPPAYGYPPPHYSPPPPPPGSSHFAPPGYGRPPPPLGPPPGGRFPPSRPEGQERRSPPSYHVGSAHSQSAPQASTRVPHAPGTTPPKGHAEPQPSKPAGLPPKPPTGRVAHPLPPKPPKSLDQVDHQRDHKNRHKRDRVNKPKDRKQKDQHIRRHSNEIHHAENRYSPPLESHGLTRPQNSPRYHHGSPERSSMGQRPRLLSGDGQTIIRRATHDTVRKRSPSGTAKSRPSLDFGDESVIDTDAGTRKQSGDSESERGGNFNPVPPSPAQRNAFRSRTSSQGSKGRGRPEASSHSDSTPHMAKENYEERRPKRPKTMSSPDQEPKRPKMDDDEECLWDTIDVPREADRRQAEKNRSGAKRRDSTGSRASKQESLSSLSSDLNSLEAELLGRPAKPKSPENPSVRHRPEQSIHSLKPKRRQANSNSAFSRRW